QTKFKVKHFEAPSTLQLVHSDGTDKAAEETVFSIQGLLSGKNLPPIIEKIRLTSQGHHLRQGVSLLSCGTHTFEQVLDVAQEIYSLFNHNVEEVSLESWTLTTTPSIMQGNTLEASNRYLAAKRDAPTMASVPILASVDPRGILDKLTKEGFIYGEENEVRYYNIHNTSEGTKRDIVEIQVSFIVMLLKDNKHKMIIVLRSIALLNPHFSQVRMQIHMSMSNNQPQ
ncbi:hypothetical protein L208DRAFT_1282863, partial [Tricholoma matsutake]